MAQPPSEAKATQAFIRSRDPSITKHNNPSLLKDELKGKVSHDQLCDTIQQQFQGCTDKLEDDLSSMGVVDARSSLRRTPQPN